MMSLDAYLTLWPVVTLALAILGAWLVRHQ